MEHAAHSAHSPEEVRKHVRIYVAVFAALAFLTVVTVGVSYLHLTAAIAVTVALFIASIKASLVGAYFMHLLSEKKLILSILVITLGTFISMILIIFFANKGVMHVVS